jgi:hypothetical protein
MIDLTKESDDSNNRPTIEQNKKPKLLIDLTTNDRQINHELTTINALNLNIDLNKDTSSIFWTSEQSVMVQLVPVQVPVGEGLADSRVGLDRGGERHQGDERVGGLVARANEVAHGVSYRAGVFSR